MVFSFFSFIYFSFFSFNNQFTKSWRFAPFNPKQSLIFFKAKKERFCPDKIIQNELNLNELYEKNKKNFFFQSGTKEIV